MFKYGFAAASLIVLTACNVSNPVGRDIPGRVVDSTFVTGQLNSRGGRDSLDTAIAIYGVDGEYVVCAAANNVDSSFKQRAIRELDVIANDTIIVNGLDWAPRYNVASLEGQQAGCRATGVAVIPDAKLDVRLARGRIRA